MVDVPFVLKNTKSGPKETFFRLLQLLKNESIRYVFRVLKLLISSSSKAVQSETKHSTAPEYRGSP